MLDKTLSDGKKLPRWKPRSRRASNMGNSAKHASTVPLVLNPETGAITAQFHVVFDDWFATVVSSESDLPDLNSDDWTRMFGDSTYHNQFDGQDDEYDGIEPEYDGIEPETSSHDSRLIHDSLSSLVGDTTRSRREQQVARAMDAAHPPTPLSVETPPQTPPAVPLHKNTPAAPSAPDVASTPASRIPETREISPPQVEQSPPMREMSQSREQLNPQQSSPRRERSVEPPVRMNEQPFTPANPRRSSRRPKTPARHGYDGTQGSGYIATDAEAYHFELPYLHTLHNFCGLWSPAVCKASVPDPDTLTFEQAMNDPTQTKTF